MQSAEMLQKALEHFSQTWLLVDALDELDANSKDDFMEVVESLKNTTKFFFTSRPQSLDSAILEESTLQCTLSAQNEDLATYIRARMGKAATASRRVRETPGWSDFVDETVNKLVSIADGMFILVTLQLDMLLRPRTLAEMRRLLGGVSNKLDDFYAATLERIRARESAVAVNVLCWLVKQMEPLTAGTLQEALAVEESTKKINPEAFIHKDDMIEMCCGLLVMDENEVLSLAHATIHEFLSAMLHEMKQFDYTVTKCCLKYLNFETFQHHTSNDGHAVVIEPVENFFYFEQEYIDRKRRHPFFFYAAYHWNTHYTKCTESDELTEMALRLIGGPNAAAMLLVHKCNKIRDRKSLSPISNRVMRLYNKTTKFRNFQGLGPLHVAAYLGQLHLVEILIARAAEKTLKSKSLDLASDLGRLIDCSDDFGDTPLMYAIESNAGMVALALLLTKAVNPSVSSYTMRAWALERNDVSLFMRICRMGTANKRLALRESGQQIEIYLECDPTDSEKELPHVSGDHIEVKVAGPWKVPLYTFPLRSLPNSLDHHDCTSDS